MSRLAVVLLPGFAVAVGCGDHRPATTKPPPPPGIAIDASPGADAAVVAVKPVAPESARIAPHNAMITATVIDRTGTAALSIDQIGDVRLWRSLDGTQPPVALPFHGPRALDLARDPDGFSIVAIDSSGTAQLYWIANSGEVVNTASVPAVPQAISVVAIDAASVLVVRADQSIALVDGDGAVVSELSSDDTRIEALHLAGTSGAVAFVSRRDGTDTRFTAVRVTVKSGKLAWGAEVELPVVPVVPVEMAITDDEKHLAYVGNPSAPKPKREPAAGAASPGRSRRRPPSEPPVNSVVVVIDLATGADVTPAATAALIVDNLQRIGFPTSETMMFFSASGGDWTTGLTASSEPIQGAIPRSSAPAIAAGTIVTGNATNLFVERNDGTTRNVGYQQGGVVDAAMSPHGDRVAWAMRTGELVIETLDGSRAEVNVPANNGLALVTFADDDHLITVSQQGAISLVAAGDGKVLSSTTAPGSPIGIQWNPRAGWLVGPREGGGEWAMRVRPAEARPWTKPTIIADGGTSMWLQNGATDDEPALITMDRTAMTRSYSGADLAAGVSVSKVGAIPKLQLVQEPVTIDGAGRPLFYDGSELTRAASRDSIGDRKTVLRISGMSSARSIPGTDTVLAVDTAQSVFAVDLSRNHPWTVAASSAVFQVAPSADGKRAVIVSAGGGQVVDVETGVVVATRCAWGFGAWPSTPNNNITQVHPVCE